MKHDSQLLNVAEVARWLQLSRSTVYDMVARNRLPSIRVANRIRFDPDDLEAFLQGARVVPTNLNDYGNKKKRKQLVGGLHVQPPTRS